MVEHAIELTLAYRKKYHDYTPDMDITRVWCTNLRLGEVCVATNDFAAWGLPMESLPNNDCLQVPGKDLAQKLFSQSEWLDHSAANALNDIAEGVGPSDTCLMYDFSVVDQCLHVDKVRGKTTVTICLANFNVIRLLNIYQFADPAIPAYYKLLVRSLVDKNGTGTFYLPIEAEDRDPCTAGFKYKDSEVLFQLGDLKSNNDMSTLFSKWDKTLWTAGFTFDHFQFVVQGLDFPAPDQAITYFGKQPSGYFVAGNACFKDGKFYSHDDAHTAIMPQYFSDQKARVLRHEYPKHILIPFLQVRYVIAVDTWNEVMPAMFLNNIVQARAVFAFGVMGLHTDRFYNGEHGIGHGMPIMWAMSSGPNTGKTEASYAVQSLTGHHHNAVWGGDPTKAALFDKLAGQSCTTLCVDDYAVEANAYSKPMRNVVCGVFDRTTRAVSEKCRTPMSTFLITSNGILNEHDKPFQSRILLNQFDELQQNEDADPNMYHTWQVSRELLSACTADFESMLWNGKLDKEAIADCASFVNAIGKRSQFARDRNSNLCVPTYQTHSPHQA